MNDLERIILVECFELKKPERAGKYLMERASNAARKIRSTGYSEPNRNVTQEDIAKFLWHRFAPGSHEEWEFDPHRSEYLDAADAVMYRIFGASLPRELGDAT